MEKVSEALYKALTKAGIETLYDDREVSAGVMFSDADLLGCPLRVVVSPKTLARGAVELISRDKTIKIDLPFCLESMGDVITGVQNQIKSLLQTLNS